MRVHPAQVITIEADSRRHRVGSMTRQADSVPSAPGGLPVVGHLARIAANPLRFFLELRDVGPVVRIGLGPRTAYAVTTPELVRQVLITSRGEYDKGGPFMRP